MKIITNDSNLLSTATMSVIIDHFFDTKINRKITLQKNITGIEPSTLYSISPSMVMGDLNIDCNH